jgi:hypothetical protein
MFDCRVFPRDVTFDWTVLMFDWSEFRFDQTSALDVSSDDTFDWTELMFD